jgi:hypothetical protein
LICEHPCLKPIDTLRYQFKGQCPAEPHSRVLCGAWRGPFAEVLQLQASKGWRRTMVSSRSAPVEMRSIGTPQTASMRSR